MCTRHKPPVRVDTTHLGIIKKTSITYYIELNTSNNNNNNKLIKTYICMLELNLTCKLNKQKQPQNNH